MHIHGAVRKKEFPEFVQENLLDELFGFSLNIKWMH